VNLILVLSIISTSFRKKLTAFKNAIEDYIQNDIGGDLDSLPALSMFSLLRNSSLEKIGTDSAYPEDFVTLIERKMLSDYQDLFLKLEQQISNFINNKTLTPMGQS